MIYQFADISVGEHFYWDFSWMFQILSWNFSWGFQFHGQVLIDLLVVISLILGPILSNLGKTGYYKCYGPSISNLVEYIYEFVASIAKTQIGEKYTVWVPFIGTLFLFIFVSNWAGALLPWKLFSLPNGELGAPTSDINTTGALAYLTSIAYFYAGLLNRNLNYFAKYIEPTPILLPINILEDFTKPLSLTFRLFGNILADELIIAVLSSLVPIIIPVPLMLLGLFTSAIQALIFATLSAAYIGEALEVC